ncbi:MAG: isochorismatase family cysteine hydrolase [Thermomicrobiales bacterium]
MSQKAVIVIDMLNDFVTGALANPAGVEITPNIAALLSHAREQGWLVVFANDAHLPGDYEEKVWGPHALAGTKEAEVIAELDPQESDIILPKRFYSSFFETGLLSILRQNGVDEVILTGQHTNICVRHTASDAFNNGFEISVPRDGVAMFRLPDHSDEDYERLQQDALDYLVNVYAASITSVEELTSASVREAVAV